MEKKRIRLTQGERREEAESRLIEAAIKLISKHGFANLTLSAVGEAAGYSRGLPAHYFGNKDSLMLAVTTHILEKFQTYAHHVSDTTKSEIGEMFRAYAHAARRNPAFTRATIMIYSESLINKPFADKLKPLIRNRIDAISEMLTREIERGYIAPLADVRAEAAMIFAVLRGSLNLLAIDAKFPLEDVFANYQEAMRSRALAKRAEALPNDKIATAG